MKPIITSGLFLLIFVFSLYAQQQPGEISIEKKGLKKIYLLDHNQVDYKELASVLEGNNASVTDFKSHKTSSIMALTMIGAGTAFIGIGFYYSVKSAQSVGDNDIVGTSDYSQKSGTNMLIGAGFYALSIPFLLRSNKKLNSAIKLYNSGNRTGSVSGTGMYAGFSEQGFGISCRF